MAYIAAETGLITIVMYATGWGPVLSIGYAAAIMVSGLTDGVEEHLRDAERWVTRTPGSNGQDPRAPSVEASRRRFGGR